MKFIYSICLFLLVSACAEGVQKSENRGSKSGAVGEEEKEVTPELSTEEEPKNDNIDLTDTGMYLADDLNGAVDLALSQMASDELQTALAQELEDQNLTYNIIDSLVGYLDADDNGQISSEEFLNSSIEESTDREKVLVAVKTSKTLVFNTFDENQDESIDGQELLKLIKVRVWLFANQKVQATAASPKRLQSLVNSGFSKLHTKVSETYGEGELGATQFEKITTALQ